jgi:hypothetical protein
MESKTRDKLSKASIEELRAMQSNLHHESQYFGLYTPYEEGEVVRTQLKLVEEEIERRPRTKVAVIDVYGEGVVYEVIDFSEEMSVSDIQCKGRKLCVFDYNRVEELG